MKKKLYSYISSKDFNNIYFTVIRRHSKIALQKILEIIFKHLVSAVT